MKKRKTKNTVTGGDGTLGQVTKKPKVDPVTGDDGTLDLISQLPDAILVQILSLLPTMYAFRTCLLSKRWQCLWTCIDNLSFVRTTCYKDENFASFVDYVFAQRTSSKITTFQLETSNMSWYDLQIKQWLTYLLDNKVENVVLKSVDYVIWYALPQFFCTCFSLMSLVLYRCAFDKEAVISWKSLTTVKFDNVELDDEVLVKLLSGCPALETIELSSCRSFRRLEIHNSNIKTVKLENCRSANGQDDHLLDVFAPYVQHLEISGGIGDVKYSLVKVSSLVSAELTFKCRCHSRDEDDSCRDHHDVVKSLVQDYLKKLSHVRELTVGSWFAEVLFMMQLDGQPLSELRCRHLTLKLQMTKCNLYGIATVLQVSPHVETLNIDMELMDYHFHCNYELSCFKKGDNSGLESWVSNFAFPNLKSINIICSFAMCWNERYHKLLELSQFILKNAMVLEKFVVIAKRRKCQFCSKNCASSYLSRLAAKLLRCPRHSTKFMLIFHESDFNE